MSSLMEKLKFSEQITPEIVTEFEPELPQDPPPGVSPSAKKATTPRATSTGRRPTASVAQMSREVAKDLATMIEIGAATWGLSDDCCAPVLEQQAKPIADALAGILARNPRLLSVLHGSDTAVFAMQALALGRALQPVGSAVYHNHVSKPAEETTDGPGIDIGGYPPYAGRPRSVPA